MMVCGSLVARSELSLHVVWICVSPMNTKLVFVSFETSNKCSWIFRVFLFTFSSAFWAFLFQTKKYLVHSNHQEKETDEEQSDANNFFSTFSLNKKPLFTKITSLDLKSAFKEVYLFLFIAFYFYNLTTHFGLIMPVIEEPKKITFPNKLL